MLEMVTTSGPNKRFFRIDLENFLAYIFHHRILLRWPFDALPDWRAWLCLFTPPMEDVVINQYLYLLSVMAVKLAFIAFILYNEYSPWWLILLIIL
jgi:hypothetical protein